MIDRALRQVRYENHLRTLRALGVELQLREYLVNPHRLLARVGVPLAPVPLEPVQRRLVAGIASTTRNLQRIRER